MACCILGPPTLSTFPASMCRISAAYELRGPTKSSHKSKKHAEKAKFGAQKGPGFLLAGSARRGFLAPRAKVHAVFSHART